MRKVILKLSAVKIKTSKSRSAIYADSAVGKFPKPIKIGERASGWLEEEIDQWIDERISSRNGEDA